MLDYAPNSNLQSSKTVFIDLWICVWFLYVFCVLPFSDVGAGVDIFMDLWLPGSSQMVSLTPTWFHVISSTLTQSSAQLVAPACERHQNIISTLTLLYSLTIRVQILYTSLLCHILANYFHYYWTNLHCHSRILAVIRLPFTVITQIKHIFTMYPKMVSPEAPSTLITCGATKFFLLPTTQPLPEAQG